MPSAIIESLTSASFLNNVWPLMLAALAAGVVDSMGGGGGLITVPTLLNLGVPPIFLLGTNKTISAGGSLPALLRYRRANLLPKLGMRVWLLLIVLCFSMAAVGASLSQHKAFLDRISTIVPILLVLVMSFMIKRWFWDEKKGKAIAHLSPQNDIDTPQLLIGKLKSLGTPLGLAGISLYDGLLGPGTGAFFMNLLEQHGIKTLTANAITKVFNLSSNLGALTFFVMEGRTLWPLGLSGAVSYAIGNYLGAGFVLKRGQGLVRTVVLVVTTTLLLRYVYRYFTGTI